MSWSTFDYKPIGLYEQRIQTLEAETGDLDVLLTDGGKNSTQFYWSGQDGVLYHTEVGPNLVKIHYNSEDEAVRHIENEADKYGEEMFSGMVLRKTGNQKVMEVDDVLTTQQDLMEYF